MNTYHKRFLSSFTCENVVGLFSRYRGAAKEITESWGMLEAFKSLNLNSQDCKVFVIGDGCSPRTGALFAYYTKADVVSIDPNFNLAHWADHCNKQAAMGFPVKRLKLIKDFAENCNFDGENKITVFVWPHSHAPMEQIKVSNYSQRIDIALPCCVNIPRSWAEIPHISFDDFNITSPKRTVHIWHIPPKKLQACKINQKT